MGTDDGSDVAANAPTGAHPGERAAYGYTCIPIFWLVLLQGQQQQPQQQQPFAASPDIGQLQMQNAERMFHSQLQELQSMGFPDRRRNLQGTITMILLVVELL